MKEPQSVHDEIVLLLTKIGVLEKKIARLREALEGVIKEYDADNNGRTLRWAIDDARVALAKQ